MRKLSFYLATALLVAATGGEALGAQTPAVSRAPAATAAPATGGQAADSKTAREELGDGVGVAAVELQEFDPLLPPPPGNEEPADNASPPATNDSGVSQPGVAPMAPAADDADDGAGIDAEATVEQAARVAPPGSAGKGSVQKENRPRRRGFWSRLFHRRRREVTATDQPRPESADDKAPAADQQDPMSGADARDETAAVLAQAGREHEGGDQAADKPTADKGKPAAKKKAASPAPAAKEQTQQPEPAGEQPAVTKAQERQAPAPAAATDKGQQPKATGEQLKRIQKLVRIIKLGGDYRAQAKARDELIAMGPVVAPEVAPLVEDAMPLVRTMGIIILRETGAPAAYPALYRLLGDENGQIRYHAILALRALTGAHFGYYYDDLPANRARARARWQAHLVQEKLLEAPKEQKQAGQEKQAEPSVWEQLKLATAAQQKAAVARKRGPSLRERVANGVKKLNPRRLKRVLPWNRD